MCVCAVVSVVAVPIWERVLGSGEVGVLRHVLVRDCNQRGRVDTQRLEINVWVGSHQRVQRVLVQTEHLCQSERTSMFCACAVIGASIEGVSVRGCPCTVQVLQYRYLGI